MPIRIDWTYAIDDVLGAGRGLSREALDRRAAGLSAHMPAVAAAAQEGALGFYELPDATGVADAVEAWAAAAAHKPELVICGIGGSALSARVFEALRTRWDRTQALHVLDTSDPVPVRHLMEHVHPKSVRLIGISKSGGTLETGATFLALEGWLRDALGEAAASESCAVVCGEEPNPLGALAAKRGYATFTIPAAVGGRFSALTPVGLLPAALMDLDVRALLAGAAAMRERVLDDTAEGNPAFALALLHHEAWSAGRDVHVLMPYGERLRPLGPWWAQLVGESLGKVAAGGPVGAAPLAATGPADQHSLLQLLREGTDDKLVVLVEAEGAGADVPVPAGDLPGAGRTLQEILRAECAATRFALAEAGRPVVTVTLPAADEAGVGAFLFLYEMVVVMQGRLLGVDPFGQPGVQLGKDATKLLLEGGDGDLAERLAAHRAVERRGTR